MDRFLVVQSLPAGTDEAGMRRALERLAELAHGRGARAVETLYNLPARRAYTLFEAHDAAEARSLSDAAGLAGTEALPVTRLHSDLLAEPRRERYA